MSALRSSGVHRASQNPESAAGGNFPKFELVALNLRTLEVMASDGEIFPITNLFDADGEEVWDQDAAARVAAGPDARGGWWLADVGAFGGTRH